MWIRAKYVQKAFVRKLPKTSEKDNDAKYKKWSVCKKKRRSPSKTTDQDPESSPDSEKAKMVQGECVKEFSSREWLYPGGLYASLYHKF